MPKFIGPVPVPKDKPLGEFIESLIERDSIFLEAKQIELSNTTKQTREEEQPVSFTYAKLLNFLNKVIEFDELVHLCAAAMWKLQEQNGEIHDMDSDGPTQI